MAAAVALVTAGALLPSATAATGSPFTGASWFVDPDTHAARGAAALRDTEPDAAALLDRIATRSQADWFGDWYPTSEVGDRVAARTATIHGAGALPVYVLYAIPSRDCGGYSAGGTNSPDAYRAWIDAVASGLDGGPTVVVLEPDALAQLDCIDPTRRRDRLDLLGYATTSLTAAGATVYLDAGHSGWHPPEVMASRLRQAGVADARGFSLNVSNHRWADTEVAYARELSAALDGAHAVVDTSRSGQGPADDAQWCNAPGRGLGPDPTAATPDDVVDAFLWVKRPGESDGPCNGGPSAGAWWTDGALELARLASSQLGPEPDPGPDPGPPAPGPTPEPSPEPTEPTDDRPPAGEAPTAATMRLWGPDRVATAVAVSRTGWTASRTVVVARSDDPADALAGAGLAGLRDAPLLITPRHRLADEVGAEIRRLGATEAVVLGGPAALSPDVDVDLREVGITTVRRVAGTDRAATAARIAGSLTRSADTALLVHQTAWPDALSVSGLAARRAASGTPWPVLLTDSSVPATTLDALEDLGVDQVVVAGGAVVVPDAVVADLQRRGLEVRRVAGDTRYETSAAVATLDLELHGGGPLVLATGAGFADGLAAGALAARTAGVMLLSRPDAADAGHLDLVADHRDALTALLVVGGEAAIAERVVGELEGTRR